MFVMIKTGYEILRRIAVSFAVFGLLIQASLTALSIPVAFAAGIPIELAAGHTSIVICSSAGMQRIVIDADGNRVEQEDQSPSIEFCSACTLVDNPVLGINALTPQTLVIGYYQSYPELSTQVFADRRIAQCPESRGPPLNI